MIFFLTLLISAALTSQAENPSHFYLRSLKDASVRTLDLKKLQKPTLFMIFQSDCSACQLQVQDLKCLEEKFDVLLIGAYSSEKRLRLESRRMVSSYPSYLGEDSFLRALHTKKGLTPELIIANKKSLKHLLGLTPCEEIARQ